MDTDEEHKINTSSNYRSDFSKRCELKCVRKEPLLTLLHMPLQSLVSLVSWFSLNNEAPNLTCIIESEIPVMVVSLPDP